MSTFNIQVTPQNNTILIVDNDQNQVIVQNPITSVVEVNSLGPQGPPGIPFPYIGSAAISGSLVVTGSVIATQGFTGSLLGTASYAVNAINSEGGNVFKYSTTEDQLNDWAGDIINGVYGFVNVTGSLLNSASYSGNFQLFEILQTSRLLSILDQTGTNITSSLNINGDTELNIGTYFSAPSGSYFTGLTFNIYNPNQQIKLYYTSSQPPLQQDSYFTTSSLRLEKNLVVVEGITGSLFGTSSYALTAYSITNTSSLATTGSNIFIGNQIITGSLIMSATGSFVLPLSQSTSPLSGSAYWSGSFLYIYDGTRYRSSSFA